MLRWRLAGLAVTLGLLVGGGAVMRVGALPASAPAEIPEVLQLFYGAPVLVRAGERVRVPVDVVCATPRGEPCEATAGIRVDDRRGRVTAAESSAVKGLEFDLTAPARRAVADRPSGAVDFALSARSASGRTVSLPDGDVAMLRFYVTRDMPVARVPAVPFGQVRRGQTVLGLPWGSGPTRVGLSPGVEAQTVGPSSFDIDRVGRVHLVDALQGRVAVFDHGRLVRETRLPVGVEPTIAVADDLTAYVLDSINGELTLSSLSRSGRLGPRVPLGPGIVGQLRVVGSRPFTNLLPLEGWVGVPAGTEATKQVTVGMPLPGGRDLVRLGREGFIRLGTVRGGRVLDAVELRSDVAFGVVALAEPDPMGGYLVVARTWRDGPDPADQFQVIRVAPDGNVRTFAVADTRFAELSPLATFRLGPDGALYQMTSSPEGIRIVRFDLEEER